MPTSCQLSGTCDNFPARFAMAPPCMPFSFRHGLRLGADGPEDTAGLQSEMRKNARTFRCPREFAYGSCMIRTGPSIRKVPRGPTDSRIPAGDANNKERMEAPMVRYVDLITDAVQNGRKDDGTPSPSAAIPDSFFSRAAQKPAVKEPESDKEYLPLPLEASPGHQAQHHGEEGL